MTPARVGLARELWYFMRVRKKYWLAPLMVVFILFGWLMAATAGSALAPFIYSIF